MDDVQNVSQDEVIENDNVDDVSASTTDENENDNLDNQNDNTSDDGEQSDESSQEDQVTFDERQQAKVNELIGAKVAKTHEERRRAEQLAEENARLKAQLPKQRPPEIPPLPNVNDFYGDPDGYRAKLAERDEAIKRRTEYDAKSRWEEEQRQRQVRKADFEKAQQQQASIQTYAETAKSYGITPEQMQRDAQTVLQVGISADLSDFIVSDPQGALIANHLAKNVLELDQISQMSPLAAAIYIDKEIKPKLASVKKSSSAPPPAKAVQGGGTPNKVPASIKGAKFE